MADNMMDDDDESGPYIFDADSTPQQSGTPQYYNDLGSSQRLTALHITGPDGTRTNLDLINECDNFPYYERDPDTHMELTEEYFALLLPGHPSIFGYLLPEVAGVLSNVGGWELNERERTLTLAAGSNRTERSSVVAQTCAAMREAGSFEVLRGWRDELYPVYDEYGEVAFDVERSASPLFGVVTYGCHMVGYVRRYTTDGHEDIRIWVPRRARTKQTYGGMLDNTVAGGISSGESAFESMVREAYEEAGLSEQLMRARARKVGAVTYFHIRDERAGGETNLLQPECQYVYDLEMPEDVIPVPTDGEAEDFRLLSIEEVKYALAQGEFKPNCAIVLLDFFIRHGILTSENERDYLEINARLHRLLEFPVARAI